MNIRELKQYFAGFVAASDELTGMIFAVNEVHAVTRLNGKSGVQLLVTFPSSEVVGPADNGVQVHSLLLMVLERSNSQSKTDEDEFEQFVRLREMIEKVRQRLAEDSSRSRRPWARLSILGTRIEPEFNLKDWNSWSCDVVF